jgi:mannose-1-phosphate guanylyltransferase
VQGQVDVAADAGLEAPVLHGAGCRIAAHAQVSQSTIGPGAVVDTGARVRRSVLLAGARVSEQAETVDSVLGPAAVLEPEVIATDRTVVGEGAVVSAGARVAGARIHVPRSTGP